jgi:hypothetical protein
LHAGIGLFGQALVQQQLRLRRLLARQLLHRLQTLLHVVAAQQAGSQAALQQGSDLPVLFSGQRFSISGSRPASGSEASCSAALRRACTSLLPSASAACAVSMTERR